MRERSWVRRELSFEAPLRRGAEGEGVRRLQEHLTLRGFATAVDGVFGPATQSAVRAFQKKEELPPAGEADEKTWLRLTQPLRKALAPIRLAEGASYPRAVLLAAEQHLAQCPAEIQSNRGPWVRLYMKGSDGSEWPWCVGFASFILAQAASAFFEDAPLPYHYSCDLLAQHALVEGVFIDGTDPDFREQVQPPCLFLVRKRWGDWTHAGIVLGMEEESFETAEGNTNSGGGREGVEAIRRHRAYRNVDFIQLPHAL